jgi:hypothetical protein
MAKKIKVLLQKESNIRKLTGEYEVDQIEVILMAVSDGFAMVRQANLFPIVVKATDIGPIIE